MTPTATIISSSIAANAEYWSVAGSWASTWNRRIAAPMTACSTPQSRKETESSSRPTVDPGVIANPIADVT